MTKRTQQLYTSHRFPNICCHCGERCSGIHCQFCKTASQRKAIDEENEKIRALRLEN